MNALGPLRPAAGAPAARCARPPAGAGRPSTLPRALIAAAALGLACSAGAAGIVVSSGEAKYIPGDFAPGVYAGGYIAIAGMLDNSGTLTNSGALVNFGTLANFGWLDNSGTLTNSGTLNIGMGGTSGSLTGNVFNGAGANLVFNRSDASSYTGVISGIGNVAKQGAGTLTLSGTNPYTGATTVAAGTLRVDGSVAGSAVTVASGATLGGSGSTGALVLQAGATLSPGNSPGTITLASLSAATASTLLLELGDPAGTPGTDSDLVVVNGNVALDGATLSISALSGFGAGTYRLINYSGSYSGSPVLSGVPTGYTATLDTSTAGQVNLVVVAVAAAATAVPTNAGWALAALALLLAAAAGWRQRRA